MHSKIIDRFQWKCYFALFMIANSFVGFSCVCLADITTDMRLNDGGYGSFDYFLSELVLNNTGNPMPDAQIFGILEIVGSYYFWPGFTTGVQCKSQNIQQGETEVLFLEFEFPNIDAFIPFGPMFFWGAWYVNSTQYGYDVSEFWLDPSRKWTPTPLPATSTPQGTQTPPSTSSPTVTSSPVPPSSTVTSTPTPTSTDTPDVTPTSTVMSSGNLFAVDSIAGNMRLVLSTGSSGFSQGSPADEACRGSNEMQFEHILTRSFVMMENEVTRQMWSDLRVASSGLPDDPSATGQSPGMQNPLQSVAWSETLLFANLLSNYNGMIPCYYTDEYLSEELDVSNYLTGPYFLNWDATGYRLPTEGEWEFACRAGSTGAYVCIEPDYSSDTCLTCTLGLLPVLEQYCTFCANDPDGTTVAGSKTANAWNIKDMHGNVWEWCWDWYHSYPTGQVTDYTGEYIINYRTYRGGGWNSYPNTCRSAQRSNTPPSARLNFLGFRLVRTIDIN